MKIILLILLLQPVRVVMVYYGEANAHNEFKAINELHAKQAVYNEDESNAVTLADQYDTLVFKLPVNDKNELYYFVDSIYVADTSTAWLLEQTVTPIDLEILRFNQNNSNAR